ncbi:MAG TPA: hypothetical protein VMZ92_08225 [Planctomycetota bacterium]|nr:hypothetical protein [Planctomycetota bacterium]
MSNSPGGGRGVSTAQLVVFILLILAGGVAAYIYYTEADRLETRLKTERDTLKNDRVALENATKTRDELHEAIGYGSLGQIKDVFATSQIKVQPETLEKLIEAKFAKRADQIKQIGVDPKQVDESGQSEFLEQVITRARQSGVVPDSLKGTKVGTLSDHLIRRDKAVAAREQFVTDGEAAVADVDGKIAEKHAETKRKFTEMDDKGAQAWSERVVEHNKLRNDPVKWTAEGKVLESKLTLEQAINLKLDHKLKLQADMATPVDGMIVSYDWRTRRGTINLGARDNMKPGYTLDVYATRPGPDRADKRLYNGRLQVLNVYPTTSVFVAVPSTWDSEERPIMAGNYVCSQIYDKSHRKVFVLKGWFPRGGDYSKAALAGLIDRDGGIVEDELTLETDYLVVGIVDEKDLANPSEVAKTTVAEGAKAYEDALHWNVTVLTVEKFFKYLNRKGMETAP